MGGGGNFKGYVSSFSAALAISSLGFLPRIDRQTDRQADKRWRDGDAMRNG